MAALLAAAPALAPAQEPSPAGRAASPPLSDRQQAAAAVFVLERILDRGGDLSQLERHYARKLRYFDQGLVDRSVVLADKAAYFRRWPERRFSPDLETLTARAVPWEGGDRAIEVEVEVDFDVAGPERRADGRTLVSVTLLPEGEDGFTVVAEGGRVISRR